MAHASLGRIELWRGGKLMGVIACLFVGGALDTARQHVGAAPLLEFASQAVSLRGAVLRMPSCALSVGGTAKLRRYCFSTLPAAQMYWSWSGRMLRQGRVHEPTRQVLASVRPSRAWRCRDHACDLLRAPSTHPFSLRNMLLRLLGRPRRLDWHIGRRRRDRRGREHIAPAPSSTQPR
jgi:hypothetical protein